MKPLCVFTIALCISAALAGSSLAQPDTFLGKSATDWINELKSDTPATRANAAFALGKLGPTAQQTAVPPLLERLKTDNDASVRDAAALAIGKIVKRGQANDQLTTALCAALANDKDANVKRSVAVALGQCAGDTPPVRSALEKAIDDPSKGVKQNAAWALGEVCARSAEPPVSSLRKAIADGDKLVMRDAVSSLGKLEAKQKVRPAMDDLLKCVGHDYIELKKAACFALVELVTPADTKVGSVLANVCKNDKEDIEVRGNAALALSNIGGADAKYAVAVLQLMLQGNDLELKRRSALALRGVGEGGKAAEDDLIALLKHKDKQLRHNVAVALGGVKSHRGVPGLVDRLADTKEEENIRVAAAVSLLNIGKCPEAVTAVPQLIDMLDNPKQPAIVRWRLLWSLRVHQQDLLNYEKLFTAMTKVLNEPGIAQARSSTGHNSGKMLRYDCAFLLAVLKANKAPDDVLPVLQEFLHDDTIRIFTGIKGGVGGAKKEGPAGGKDTVNEEGTEDGRIMAIAALERLGKDRVMGHPEIIAQLRNLANNPMFETNLREKTKNLLTQWDLK
jgi:HEAT repeat protein